MFLQERFFLLKAGKIINKRKIRSNRESIENSNKE